MYLYLRTAFFLVIVFILATIQYSFIQILPFWFNYLNLMPVVLIFILSLYGWKEALFWGIGMGVVLDIYSFLPFGVFTASLMLTVFFIHVLSTHFFTNRSLYSFLALTLFSTFFYEFFFRFFAYALNIFVKETCLFLLQQNFWLVLGKGIIMNLALMFLMFYIFNFASNRFRPVFIRK